MSTTKISEYVNIPVTKCWNKVVLWVESGVIHKADAEGQAISLEDYDVLDLFSAHRDHKLCSRPLTLSSPAGSIFKLLNGVFHCTRGPAIEYITGTKKWYFRGDLHRVDGPACTYSYGGELWYQYNLLHRTDGPAIVRGYGIHEWWHKGKKHRADGPAYEDKDGTLEWWVDGLRHREKGPAVIKSNGDQEWWIKGQRLDPLAESFARFEFENAA